MSAFLAVIKNNFFRLIAQKSQFLIYCILSIIAIVAAIFFQNHSEKIGTIAVVSDQITLPDSPYINIVSLSEKPPISDLVLGKYDAFISVNKDKQYTIETIKDIEFFKKLTEILNNPQANFDNTMESRSVGTNIIGFLMMFILMQSSSIMFLFSQDKEQGQLKRIITAPLSFASYLLAQVSFVFIFLFIPPMTVLAVIKLFIPVTLGFSLATFSGLMTIICLFATALSLFLNSVIKNGDSANMLSSALVVITSILAGCFYPFKAPNHIVQRAINLLPQTIILNLSTQLEQQQVQPAQYPYILTLAAIIICLFIMANQKTKKQVLS